MKNLLVPCLCLFVSILSNATATSPKSIFQGEYVGSYYLTSPAGSVRTAQLKVSVQPNGTITGTAETTESLLGERIIKSRQTVRGNIGTVKALAKGHFYSTRHTRLTLSNEATSLYLQGFCSKKHREITGEMTHRGFSGPLLLVAKPVALPKTKKTKKSK